jgi:dGTPase
MFLGAEDTMNNKFYNHFDTACLDEERSSDYRSPFETDRDRIIHTSAFRRLQAKTQVFFSGEYDFYRTRLTHSLEVAQIGRSVCNFLLNNDSLLSTEFFIDPNLIEAVCLSHDLGHPPFGHAGERTLNGLMKQYGGFEGNAQTLRLIAEIIYSGDDKRKGMNPTRAFLDGILKYKTFYSRLNNPEHHFLYDHQGSFVEFAMNGKIPAELAPGKTLNSFRSIECQIMDWSDDAAYSLNDLADGIHSGLMTKGRMEQWASEQSLTVAKESHLSEIFDAIRSGSLERTIARKIGSFIKACRLTPWKNFMSELTNRYAFRLEIDPDILEEAELYKKISLELVFLSPQIRQLEHKGDYIIRRLFDVYEAQYIRNEKSDMHLLPSGVERTIRATSDKSLRARLLCDYIAGMTDGFAIRTYKRLFDPDFGSLADLV